MAIKLTQLSDNVWLWPGYREPAGEGAAVGVIAGQGETVLVDAGNSPRVARQLKEALSQAGLPRVSRIIYTHHHWDHVYGACEFDAPVVAHVVCREILLEGTEKPWIRNWSLTIDHATHLENVIIEPH
jgi:glyoxylase-like metal-dependent hydrolase (beta-lactamase superfamily II)